MTTSTKRKSIQVASFSMRDIARPQAIGFIVGAALVAASAVAGWAALANARALADSRSAARELYTISNQVIAGTHAFATGGGQRLQVAATSSQTVSASFKDLRAGADTVMIAPAVKAAAAGAYGSWSNLAATLTALAPPLALTGALNDGMGQNAPALAAVLRRLESAGRQGTKPYESAARLYSYAEAGFGLASVPRIDYDLQVLAADAAELGPEGAFVQSLLSASHDAAAKKVTSEQLKAALDAANDAKQVAAELDQTAGSSQAPTLLELASAAFALVGVVIMVAGLRGVVTEFAGRYVRNVQQFRGSEQARAELVAGLREAGKGALNPIRLSSSSQDIGEICALVNELFAHIEESLDSGARVMRQANESGLGSLKIADKAEAGSEMARSDLDRTSEALRACAEASLSLSLDAQALMRTAQEASARSADATQVAQDASSRLEAMREGLQDTVKRIKRLGERSQEVNGVVESMEVLSEQIAVLALNANLEAERAGDAGIGFRLVAREVSALARRSEDALRKMGELVQGVQADARAASEAAERSTSQVVAGTNIGVVSQSLLGVLAPLAEDIGSLSREVGAAARRTADAAVRSTEGAARVKTAVDEIAGQLRGLRATVEVGQRGLSDGIAAIESLRLEHEGY